MQYIYKIVDAARDGEVVGYIHTERDLLDFLRDVPEEAREKMDLIPAAVEKEGKSEAEAPRKNANDWYWEHKDDRNLAQPRKEKVYPKYINGMTEEDVQRKIEEEKKRADERDTTYMIVMFFFLVINSCFLIFVVNRGLDCILDVVDAPVLIECLIILIVGALSIGGFIVSMVVFPAKLTEKLMGGPILSGKELEDYVRQKYAYKVLTPEELEQTNMRMQPKQKEHTQQKNKKRTKRLEKELKDQKKAKNRNNKMICKIQKWLDEEEK